MWNDKQRTQKIAIDLARVKRELADQDRTFAELMREHFVSEEDLAAAGEELAAQSETEEAPVDDAPARAAFVGAYVVRG
jgi:hypothetical protein